MSVVLVPCVLSGEAFVGVSLSLGVLAGALSETDDHPRGRIKALLLTIASFFVSSASVELLRPFPWLFAAGLSVSTFGFIILGGLGERYRGITFGAILVAQYALLGAESSPSPLWQPILLPLGALFYGLISLGLLVHKPWRLLEEQLARGFDALSAYLAEKALLFPSQEQEQARIRHRLAMLNVEVVTSLEKCKEVLNSYGDALGEDRQLLPFLERFMLLQSLHERAASSHERYEVLSRNTDNLQVLEGFGEMLHQLSHACRLVADNLLTGAMYRHPVALDWLVSALEQGVEQLYGDEKKALQLLLHNLSRSHLSLKYHQAPVGSRIAPRLLRDSRSLIERLKTQLTSSNARFRYALRLTACFLAGYGLMQWLDLPMGGWMMLTSLFVCQPSYSETRRRLFQRVGGTIAGVVAGMICAPLLPTLAGQTLLMLAAAFMFFLKLRHGYSQAVVYITLFVLCAFNLISGTGMEVMPERLGFTLAGAFLALLAVRFLWPDWQYRRLPGLLSNAFLGNMNYFRAILDAYVHPAEDDLDYRVARRNAHKADNDLAMSWRGMRLEPRSRRQLMEHAYNLTYLNHALLSYLSALAAHRDSGPLLVPDWEDLAGSIERVLRQTASMLTDDGASVETPHLEDVLLFLGDQIGRYPDGQVQQQLRLFFNVADVSNKLLREARSLTEFNRTK